MKKKILFKGCGTAICTPFDKDEYREEHSDLKYFIKFSGDSILIL